jgi:hypothetical protein
VHRLRLSVVERAVYSHLLRHSRLEERLRIRFSILWLARGARLSTAPVRCLDHVVPLVRTGSNSYRNLVSSCVECNSQKGETPAEDFLRSLYRDGRLKAAELTGRARLQALRFLPRFESSIAIQISNIVCALCWAVHPERHGLGWLPQQGKKEKRKE